MRPLRLTMRGFRSYRDEVTFDLDGRALVGVVGPTGSGKSSILEAVAFALYGRTSSEGAGSRRLIHAGADSAHVELWFSVGDEVLRVTRMVRARGQGAQTLSLHTDLDGEVIRTLATGATDIGAEVETRLGLDFPAFSRSVLLAQNQFAHLLTATGSEAEKVLTGLFGFGVIEEMRAEVATRLSDAKALLAQVEKARAMLEEDRASLALAEEALVAANDRHTALVDLDGRVSTADAAITLATSERHRLMVERDRLVGVSAGLPNDAEATRLVAAARTREDRLGGVRARLEAAEASLAAATAARDAALATDLPGAISQLASRIEAVAVANEASLSATEALAAATAVRASAEEAHAGSLATLATAEAVFAEAETVHTAALAGAEAVARRNDAHRLAETLAIGRPCPVCFVEVVAVPRHAVPDDVDAATATTAAAAAGLAAARADLDEARAASVVATTGLEVARAGELAARRRAEQVVVEGEAAARALAEALTAIPDAGADAGGRLAAARHRWKALTEGVAARQVDVTRAQEELAAVEDEVDGLAGLVPLLGAAARALEIEVHLAGGVTAAEQALAEIRETVRTRSGALAADLDEAITALDRAKEALSTVLDLAGVSDVAGFGAAVALAGNDVAAAAARRDERAGAVARQEQAVATAAHTAADADRLDRLRRHLGSSAFPQYLLDERRRELADVASVRFGQLSAGRYGICLVDDVIAERHDLGKSEVNRFAIRDHGAADRVRPASTLSGGETFLASLALALGLATLVAMGGGRLDAFFVDEGFGSLDADALDLAMEGIERLVADHPERLVVVVSHVPEMRQRIEDLIVLDTEPGTGRTTVVRA